MIDKLWNKKGTMIPIVPFLFYLFKIKCSIPIFIDLIDHLIPFEYKVEF